MKGQAHQPRMHEVLPLERERERGTMPRESPCEGVVDRIGH